MLDALLESRARPTRRAGGGVVSLMAHGAVVFMAVVATAKAPAAAATPPKVEVVKVAIAPPKPVEVAPSPPAASSAPAAATPQFSLPVLPQINIADVVPIALPDIHFDAAPTADDQQFARVADGSPGILGGEAGGGGPGNGVGSGSGLWSGAELAMRLLTKVTPPRYPISLQNAGVEGRVVVKFVVDTTGRIDMNSVEVVESAHPLFLAAVRVTLTSLRFVPAAVGDRKLNAQAIMPFIFQMK